MNQPLIEQKRDWSRVKQYLNGEKGSENEGIAVDEKDGLAALPLHLKTITRSDWQKLFSLIPQMEQSQRFGELKGGERIGENMTTMPYWESNEVVRNFSSVAYELGLVVSFDWPQWEDGKKILADPWQDYNELDTITLCKLITAILRADRFNDGYLVSCFNDGTILKIVLALKQKIEQE